MTTPGYFEYEQAASPPPNWRGESLIRSERQIPWRSIRGGRLSATIQCEAALSKTEWLTGREVADKVEFNQGTVLHALVRLRERGKAINGPLRKSAGRKSSQTWRLK